MRKHTAPILQQDAVIAICGQPAGYEADAGAGWQTELAALTAENEAEYAKLESPAGGSR